MSELKQSTKDLASHIQDALSIDAKTGVVTLADGTYVKHLPEGVSESSVRKLQDYNSEFIAAAALAVGEAGVPVLKKNKDLEKLDLEATTVGKDSIGVVFARSREDRVPGTDKTVTQYGAVRATMTNYSTKPVGQFKAVKDHLNDLAEKALAK